MAAETWASGVLDIFESARREALLSGEDVPPFVGDQDSLIVGFAQPGEPDEHAIVALVDHNLSGQAKDAWIAGDVEEVVAAWSSNDDPHLRVDEAPVQETLERLHQAMAMSDLWNGDTELRTEEFAHYRALVWARLRRAGHGDERHERSEIPQSERDAIVATSCHPPPGAS